MNESDPWTNEELLRKLYVGKGMSASEIADRFGCCATTVTNWMEKFGIDRRDPGPSEKVWDARRKLPSLSIDSEGYERWTSSYQYESYYVYSHRLLAVSIFGFDRVADMQVHHKNGLSWDNRPENIELLTQAEHDQLHAVMDSSPNISPSTYRSEEWLREKYHDEGLIISEIAELAGVTDSTIYRHMKRHGIECRTSAQSRSLRQTRTRMEGRR